MNKQWLISLFTGAALMLGATSAVYAEADPKLWSVMKEAFFEKRAMKEVDFMKIEAPKRAESGAQVPVTYSIDNAAADKAGVKIVKLYSFVDANPIPLTATYHLTEALGEFNLSTRIRFETDAFVRLVGETADGKLYLASRMIRAAGGCGGIVSNDEAAVRAAAGKIRMKVEKPKKFGSSTTAKVNIKHIMRTGLQRDLVSQGFLPPYYIKTAKFTYAGELLMSIDVNVGTAEDPYFKFNFIPTKAGTLTLVASDNEGRAFTKGIEVKSQ